MAGERQGHGMLFVNRRLEFVSVDVRALGSGWESADRIHLVQVKDQ